MSEKKRFHDILAEIDPGYQTALQDLPVAHVLNTWPPFFEDMRIGVKHFDFRKRKESRVFQGGQYIILREQNQHTKEYTGRWDLYFVSYVLTAEDAAHFKFHPDLNGDILGLLHVSGN